MIGRRVRIVPCPTSLLYNIVCRKNFTKDFSFDTLQGERCIIVNVPAENISEVKNFLRSLPALLRREWRAVFAVFAANVIFAFAVNYFTLPYRFPDLGISGLAVLSNYVFGISPSWIIFIGNALLIVWGRRSLNLRFLVLTFSSIVVFSLFIPIFRGVPLDLPRDKFMATVITGLLKGVAIGMLFNVGGSSGGLDIIA